jgi:hypothetical protein
MISTGHDSQLEMYASLTTGSGDHFQCRSALTGRPGYQTEAGDGDRLGNPTEYFYCRANRRNIPGRDSSDRSRDAKFRALPFVLKKFDMAHCDEEVFACLDGYGLVGNGVDTGPHDIIEEQLQQHASFQAVDADWPDWEVRA